ncbi:hypothetical protein CWR61_04265 [Bordetella bronchiseptica]|nr:hypothetical protein CWR61_04265 [Bordetella bronchiseptica]
MIRIRYLAIAFVALAGAGGLALQAREDQPERFDEIVLQCLDEQAMGTVRRTGSVDSILPACQPELTEVLGEDFGVVDEPTLRAVLATVAAANFAEYGSSSAVAYDAIEKSQYLNCGNLVFLMGYLYGGLKEKGIRPIGMDGGAVGNHAQIMYKSGNNRLLLDPTTGVVAATTFNKLMSGQPVPEEQVRVFRVKARTIEPFRDKVYRAVVDGGYLPSDLMYMHESLWEMKTKGSSSVYFTPGGITVRKKLSKAAG